MTTNGEHPPIQAQLTITLYQGGSVNISGPIDNRLLCYGMLELGKELIVHRAAQAEAEETEKPDIVVAPAGSVPPFRPKLS